MPPKRPHPRPLVLFALASTTAATTLLLLSLLVQPAAAAVQRLNMAQVAELWRNGGYAYLDIRTPEELTQTGESNLT